MPPVRDAAFADLVSVDADHADADAPDTGAATDTADRPLCGDLGRRCAANELCTQRWRSPAITYACVAIPSTCDGQVIGCPCLETLCGLEYFCSFTPQEGSLACVFKG
jgi:hypothetical protein